MEGVKTEGVNEQMSGLEKTLAERGARYGDFESHALISSLLKDLMHSANGGEGWQRLAYDQREALEMIAHKIARILNGDPNYADSWVDIGEYATLVAKRLEKLGPEAADEKPSVETPTGETLLSKLPDTFLGYPLRTWMELQGSLLKLIGIHNPLEAWKQIELTLEVSNGLIKSLREENATLRSALRDAIRSVECGQRGHIGRSEIFVPEIAVGSVERWKAAAEVGETNAKPAHAFRVYANTTPEVGKAESK